MSQITIDPRRLERLLEVGRGLVAHHDPEAVLEEVLEAARDLTGARYAALGVLDADGRWLSRFLAVGVDEQTRLRIGPPPRGHGILGELIRNPEPLRLEEISEHPHSYGFPTGHPQMSTFLGVPVRIRDEVFGNLYLTEKEGASFDAEDEEVLVVLAEWAAIAIDNARAHEASFDRRRELERAVRGLEATVSLSREVGGETELARVLELIVKRGRALVDGLCCVVYLMEGEELRPAAVAGEIDRDLVRESVASDSPVHDPLRSGRSLTLDAPEMPRFGIAGVTAGSALMAPLSARGRDLGVLVAFRADDAVDGFSSDDVLAMESFATSASTSIHATLSIEDEKVRLSIASSERERRRWARELHDETLQELGALNVMLESALQVEDAASRKAAMRRSSEQIQRVIAGLHGLITELRPAALDDLGVTAAVEALIDRTRTRSTLTVELDIHLPVDGADGGRLPAEVEATIYRTVQEALNNVVKHASATRARVLVEQRAGEIAITVEDDGGGIGDADDGQGFGLLGMRERIALVGGSLAIVPAERGGTRISARIPLATGVI